MKYNKYTLHIYYYEIMDYIEIALSISELRDILCEYLYLEDVISLYLYLDITLHIDYVYLCFERLKTNSFEIRALQRSLDVLRADLEKKNTDIYKLKLKASKDDNFYRKKYKQLKGEMWGRKY
jgi:hypothetical protein